MKLKATLSTLAAAGICMTSLVACGDDSTTADPQDNGLKTLRVGYVGAIDQIGLPIGLERGFFEKEGLNVKLSQPFPTGVDALNALQAGEVDVVQAGTPVISAAEKGDDLKLLGNYTGSSSQASIDKTMAVVAKDSSGVKADDLKTLKGKKIGVSVGSINHLYLLGLLEKAGLTTKDVKISNIQPPDMPVALKTNGIDVAIVWDPWPIVTTKQVDGAKEILRGGGYIPFIGYHVATSKFANSHPDLVKKYLTARAGVDQWMRNNPEKAGEAATRSLPGTDLDVAKKSMKYNVEQLDPRMSACNVLALSTISKLLAEQGAAKAGFDAPKHFEFGPIKSVMAKHPELFKDLPQIPAGAQLKDNFTYNEAAAKKACA